MQIMRDLEVDLGGLSKVNKNDEHPVVKNQIEKIINNQMRGAEVTVASNQDYVTQEMRKPGGVMIVRSKWARSVGKINKDELGRWTRTTLTTENFRLAVYKVYVPSGTSLGGPATVRRQLQHSVDRRGGTLS